MSADELVDVIDEHGRVLSIKRRAEVRQQNLRHRSTYILVFNAAGDLFVHRRTFTKDIYPGYWDVAISGVLGSKEDYTAGALRELAEELGLVVASLEPLFSFRFEDEHNRVIGEAFRCQSEGPFVLQPDEVVEGRWMAVDEVLARMRDEPFCPDGAEVLRLFLSRGAGLSARLSSRS